MNNLDLYKEKAKIEGYRHAYEAVLELEKFYKAQYDDPKKVSVWLQDSGVCTLSYRTPVS